MYPCDSLKGGKGGLWVEPKVRWAVPKGPPLRCGPHTLGEVPSSRGASQLGVGHSWTRPKGPPQRCGPRTLGEVPYPRRATQLTRPKGPRLRCGPRTLGEVPSSRRATQLGVGYPWARPRPRVLRGAGADTAGPRRRDWSAGAAHIRNLGVARPLQSSVRKTRKGFRGSWPGVQGSAVIQPPTPAGLPAKFARSLPLGPVCYAEVHD